MKELLIEKMNEERNNKIAKLLGITFDELNQLDYEIDTEESNEGLVYNYIITFSEESSKEILSKIEGLEDGRRVYISPWEIDDQYDYDDQYAAIIENKNYLEKFEDEMVKLGLLYRIDTHSYELNELLKRQVYISVIGTLETFLSDVFINLVNDSEDYFKNFIETHPAFKKRKIELSEIYKENSRLKETAKIVMLDTIYHNLPVVKEMYAATLKIEFPEIKDVYPLILTRHDLVHRNGKTKEGMDVVISEKKIEELINTVVLFVKQLADKLNIRAK